MDSPLDVLQRREREIDAALTLRLRALAGENGVAGLARRHPLAALGGSAIAGLVAARFALGARSTGALGARSTGRGALFGLRSVLRPLRSFASVASWFAVALNGRRGETADGQPRL